MHTLWEDIRHAVRLWASRPAFAAVVVVTLALGIGANAAIFSVVDAVLLEPLPYPEPDRLTLVTSQFPALGFDKFWVSAPEYLELRRWARSFEEIGAYTVAAANLSGGERPLRVTAAYVTASLFPTLGVATERGRPFTEEEDGPGVEPVAVLGHDLWMRAFAGDPDVVGRTVEVDGARHTVVGILPPGFDVEDAGVELWLPLAIDPANPGGRGSHYLYLLGRLAPGVSLTQARHELTALLTRWEEEFPDDHRPNPEGHALRIDPLKEDRVGEARPALMLLLGAVGLVLLIACANVANLLLARAEARQREIAVRTALGASGARLLRQFLTESLLLAFVGALVGLAFAQGALELLLAANPGSLPRMAEIGLDARVLAFTLAVALATGVLFGLVPALHARTRAFFHALKEGGGRSSAGVGRQTFRRALVVAEVALAAVLVVGAGLLLKSFWTLTRVDPGFEPRGVLGFQLSVPSATYPEPEQVNALYERLLERLAALPGAESAAAMTGLPPSRSVNANSTEFESVPEDPDGPPHNVDYYQFVSEGYFETMKIPRVSGRVFESTDAAGGAPVVVVNRTLARTFWGDVDPVGQRLRRGWFGDDELWCTIVGVVEDVKQGGLDQEAGTELYFLDRQVPATVGQSPRTRWVVVRTAGDPLSLAPQVHAVVRELAPSLPVARLQPLEQVVSDSLARSRFLSLLVALFGLLALALAAVGTYGVLSWAVEQRRFEMGVRMALGARAQSLLMLVLGQGLRLVGVGLAVGLVLAVASRRVVASLLFGVEATDPATLASVGAVLLAVALVACLIPALRAMRVDPVTALRSE
jgi:putative ABC transport system permease protein